MVGPIGGTGIPDEGIRWGIGSKGLPQERKKESIVKIADPFRQPPRVDSEKKKKHIFIL